MYRYVPVKTVKYRYGTLCNSTHNLPPNCSLLTLVCGGFTPFGVDGRCAITGLGP